MLSPRCRRPALCAIGADWSRFIGMVTMAKAKQGDQVLRIVAQLDGLFAAEGCSPADADRWRELKRHVTRMLSSLILVATSLAKMRELGIAPD
jgi:hypothetical protein